MRDRPQRANEIIQHAPIVVEELIEFGSEGERTDERWVI